MIDNVSHPSHYEGNTSIECIDAMRLGLGDQAVYDFCLCNAFKYMWRYKNKNGTEDLDKAEWYIKEAKKININLFNQPLFSQSDKQLCSFTSVLTEIRNKDKNN